MTREFTSWDFIQYIESLKSSINNPILKPICNNLGQIVGGVFGLVNLLSAIQDFSTISKEVKNFEEFREDLKKIVDQFEENKKSIFDDNIFHSSFENIKKKIKNGLKEIMENINQLNKLISRIEEEIKKCEHQQNLSLGFQFMSSLLSGFNVGNYMITKNNFYLFSGACHTTGMIINTANIIRYIGLIKDLKVLLEEAKKKREKMNEDIKEIQNYLSKKLKIITEGIPSYC